MIDDYSRCPPVTSSIGNYTGRTAASTVSRSTMSIVAAEHLDTQIGAIKKLTTAARPAIDSRGLRIIERVSRYATPNAEDVAQQIAMHEAFSAERWMRPTGGNHA